MRWPPIQMVGWPPRLFVFGRRVHHAIVGGALLVVPDWRARAVGLALIVHDLPDRRVWVRDILRHPAMR